MKVLLATNSEHGQANVFLAVGHALQALEPSTQVHFASFAPISPAVSSASEYSVRSNQGAQPWAFHELPGPNCTDAAMARFPSILETLAMPPRICSVMQVLKSIMGLMLPWDGPDFVQICRTFAQVAENLGPDIVVVDNLFSPVLTVCHHLKLKHLLLSPNSLKDFSVASQPRAAMFWKYPVIGSAFDFPVPKRHIPTNIFYGICLVYFGLTDKPARALSAYVKREMGAEFMTYPILRGRKILVAHRPETDYPLVIPPHLIPCGPIVRPVPPVSEVDSELSTWLKRGPTVFVCLGTLREMAEEEAVELAGAIEQLLRAADEQKRARIGGVPGRLQVLWKLKRNTGMEYGRGPGSSIYSILGRALDSDLVRILDWLKPEPSAILQAGTVLCSVHHGGANSFNDALISGIPQIVLSSWLDCYEFASRVEFLGIGCWGNKQSMPKCSARELGPILVDVVLGQKVEAMRARARELADVCALSPGASVAASVILEEMKD